MTQVYLALYKGRKRGKNPRQLWQRLTDWAVRTATHAQYSHCEIAVKHSFADDYHCYSASLRDGGVRSKTMPLPEAKWDLIELPDSSGSLKTNLAAVFAQTQGQRYDLPGALGVVLANRQRADKWFCSEFCATVLGLRDAWRFSPNDLAAIAGSLKIQAETKA
nr:MAG TPA: cysteine peptidase [Caudoviricetes sp.]